MKGFKIRVTLTDFKKQIYRVMEVSEDLTLKTFCEDIIYAFNGDCSHLYALYIKGIKYMDGECSGAFYDEVMGMKGKKLKSLNLMKGEKLLLNYDFGDN